MSVILSQSNWSAQRATGVLRIRFGNLSLGLMLGLLMIVTIAGTLVAGKAVAFATIPIYVFAVFVLSVKEPSAALAVFFAYSAMEGMFKYLSEFNSAIYIIKPTLLLMVAGGWLLNFNKRRIKNRMPPMTKTVALFLLWGAAQIFHPFCAGVASGVTTLLIWYALPALLMLVGHNLLETRDQELRLRYALVAICTVVSLFAIVQFVAGLEWTAGRLPGYNTITSGDWWTADANGKITFASFRPASTTAQGGGGGYWGHIGAMLSITLLAVPGLPGRLRLLLAACLLTNVLGIMVCGVRLYVVLAIVEGAIWVFLTARTPRELMRNVGVGVAALIVVSGSFFAAQALSGGHLGDRYGETLSNPLSKFQKDRGDNFSYLPTFLADFPLGISYQRGVGGKEDAGSDAVAANRETQMNATADDMGIPGLILLFALMFGIPVVGFRALRQLRTPSIRPVGAMYVSLLVGYILMGLAGPSLQAADFYWLFAGLMTALPFIERSSGQKRTQDVVPVFAYEERLNRAALAPLRGESAAGNRMR